MSVETEPLEPAHQVGADGHGHHPVAVGLEAGEGESAKSGVLQTLDVLFDMGVGPHGDIEFDRRTLRVGVEAPVTELETWEQAALCSGVERFTSNDQ